MKRSPELLCEVLKSKNVVCMPNYNVINSYLPFSFFHFSMTTLLQLGVCYCYLFIYLFIYLFMVDNQIDLDLFLFVLNIYIFKNKCLNVTVALHVTIIE